MELHEGVLIDQHSYVHESSKLTNQTVSVLYKTTKNTAVLKGEKLKVCYVKHIPTLLVLII